LAGAGRGSEGDWLREVGDEVGSGKIRARGREREGEGVVILRWAADVVEGEGVEGGVVGGGSGGAEKQGASPVDRRGRGRNAKRED